MLMYFSVEIVCLLQSQPQGLLERTTANICHLPLPSSFCLGKHGAFYSISSPQEHEVIADHQALILLGSGFSLLIIIQEQKTEFDLEGWVAF